MASTFQNSQRLIILAERNGQAHGRIFSRTANYLAKLTASNFSQETSRLLHTSAAASSFLIGESTTEPRQKFFYKIAASFVAKHNKFISNRDSYDIKINSTDTSHPKSLTRHQHQKLYTNDRPKSGQDAFFVSKVGQSQDIAMGVADGVGGWSDTGVDPADFSHGLCHYMKYAASTYEKEKWDGADLHARSLIRLGFNNLCQDNFVKAGSSTACVAVARDNGVLEVANLGDSGYVVLRPNSVYSYSNPQVHAFNAPFQLAIIPHQLQLQTALYGNTHFNDAPEQANVTENNLKHGDVVIIGSDGLWDNLFYSDILRIVSERMIRAQAWEHSSKEFRVGKDLATKVLKCPDKVEHHNRTESLHRTIAIDIAAEAKKASLNKLRDGPFCRELLRTNPDSRFTGGKVDDICIIVTIACEEDK